ncbi:unnamed protein product [Lymnaea stagnalis]|uniref:AIG1-type G domain-containing protein n=1 Tax=Lymnaea stagnalis TaxID=6523 RepID=A0AAV2GZY9_LYMST
MSTFKDYTLILVGKTGLGKSTTGNTIIGEPKFQASDSGKSVTSECQVEEGENFGYRVTVVDTPGVMDTTVNSDEAKVKTRGEMIEAISECTDSGKRALCLVLKYGERFTEENKKSLYILTCVFGDEFLAKSCVIIFTHGDSFDENYEEEEKSFDEWCREQQEELGDLLKACEYRCVLFRNKTESVDIKKNEMEELFRCVEALNESYTDEKFTNAKKRHKRLLLESNLKRKLDYFNKKIEDLHTEIDEITLNDSNEETIQALKDKAEEILNEIKLEEDGVFYDNGELSLLKDQINRIEKIFTKSDELLHFAKLNEIKRKMLNDIRSRKSNITQSRRSDFAVKRITVEIHKHEIEKLRNHWREHVKIFIRSDVICQKLFKDSGNNTFLSEQDLNVFDNVFQKFDLMMDELRILEEDVTLSEKNRTEKEIDDEIKALFEKLHSIPSTETNTKTATEIKNEADALIESLKGDTRLDKFLEQIIDLKTQAEQKITKCENNYKKWAVGLGVGIATGLVGTAGVVAMCSKHVVANVVGKFAPSAANFLLNFGSRVCTRLFNN